MKQVPHADWDTVDGCQDLRSTPFRPEKRHGTRLKKRHHLATPRPRRMRQQSERFIKIYPSAYQFDTISMQPE